MADLALTFGGDFVLDATGDLLVANETQATQQRVIRRALTNAGAYIQHPEYGAGLAAFIGQPNTARRINAIMRRQLKLERGVAPIPAATSTVQADQSGNVTLHIQYADRATGAFTTASGSTGR